MGVLRFDGVNDRLKWTTLATALANVSDGAWTLAVVLKRAATLSFDGHCYLLSGTDNGTTEAGVSFSNIDLLIADISGVSGCVTVSSFTNTASPYMFVMSKTAGNVFPRVGWKLGSGGAWTHEDFTVGTVPDQIAATMLEIGAWQTGDPLNAWVGVVAWWEGAMSDANKELLDNNWRTSDLWTSAHGQPLFLAELNVAGASVIDLAGNATVLTATETTLDAGETLDSWNFDGTGVGTVQFMVAAMELTGSGGMIGREYV